MTVATGPLSDAEAERTGLVATHAYAVLDVRLANVSMADISSFLSRTL